MDNTIKVSIIIPIYNREHFLDKCIGSIIKQKYNNLEIILVDDGSKDSSLEICNKWKKCDDRIKVFHKENGGVQSARNLGIENASGEFLTFVDADDYVSEMFIYNFLFALQKEGYITNGKPNCIEEKFVPIVVSGHYRVDGDENVLAKNNYLTQFDVPDDIYGRWAIYFERFACYCWNHLYKTSIIKNNKLLFNKNIAIYDDTAFTMNYIPYTTDVLFTKSNDYYYVCEHEELTVTKSLNKKIVADDGSLEKLKTCIDLYNKLNVENELKSINTYEIDSKNHKTNIKWLSTVLYHIVVVCLVMYESTIINDYRYNNDERRRLFDDAYNLVKNANINEWYYDASLLHTKFNSIKYVKMIKNIFNKPKVLFDIFCNMFGNRFFNNIRVFFRIKRINKM